MTVTLLMHVVCLLIIYWELSVWEPFFKAFSWEPILLHHVENPSYYIILRTLLKHVNENPSINMRLRTISCTLKVVVYTSMFKTNNIRGEIICNIYCLLLHKIKQNGSKRREILSLPGLTKPALLKVGHYLLYAYYGITLFLWE